MFLFVTHRGPRASVGERRAPGSVVAAAPKATSPVHGRSQGPRLQPEVRKLRPALSARRVGWEEEGEGRRGAGEARGDARGARNPSHRR